MNSQKISKFKILTKSDPGSYSAHNSGRSKIKSKKRSLYDNENGEKYTKPT